MRALYLIPLATLSQVGATDCGQVLRDSGFDLWCGDELCAWKLERGEIRRVPTWHEGDSGVELIGPDTAIAQLSPVDSGDGSCIEFSLIANVEPNAEVYLHLDVSNDGRIDHSERIPTSSWKPLSYQLLVRVPYAGVRFQLTKQGGGRAMLANIGAKMVTGCEGLTPIDARPSPLGTPCQTNADCASELCGTSLVAPPYGTLSIGVCIACDDTRPCGGDEVCGIGTPVSPVRPPPTQCVPRGAKELGERCVTDPECADGYCQHGACSACSDLLNIGGMTSRGCPAGERCGPAWQDPDAWVPGLYAAWVCSPGERLRASGEACGADADCANGACLGTELRQCRDGRACVTAAQCPFEGLQQGACTTVGLQGGTCQ
jgi:hypothetical protein